MPSPFPGMNPYLEQSAIWQDFHDRFLPALADEIGAQVSDRYTVRLEAQLYIHEPPAETRRLFGRGDVGVTPGPGSSRPTPSGQLLTPLEVELIDVDVERISRVEIRDRWQRALVTVIEVLSPTNKTPGPDRAQYEAKRRQILASPTHFVEIDLLRGGPRLPMKPIPACAYCILISRHLTRPKAELLPLQLRDRLPVFPIPLRQPDADATVNLQKLLDRVYDAAHYENDIYLGAPEPALTPADDAWARQFLPAPS
jgi:hypothetical protein